MTEEIKDVTEEIVTRKNDFCVISKEANENGWRDLQKNSAWSANPYGDAFVVVPDDMVEAIWDTCGYCDIELNEDGTEVVSFTPTEIPEFEPVEEPMDEITGLQLALVEQYETNLALEEEVTNTQLALCELYEGGIA